MNFRPMHLRLAVRQQGTESGGDFIEPQAASDSYTNIYEPKDTMDRLLKYKICIDACATGHQSNSMTTMSAGCTVGIKS